MARADLIEVERIGVLHQKFARTHHAEAGPHLVTELPLDVIKIERQILVGAHRGAENLGDHLLVGRPVQHIAVVPVADAQHLLAVIVVASGFAPQVSRLDGRHQDLDRAGAILLLADDGADFVQDPDAERQPGVTARRLLPDHAGAQHQPMRDDFRLFRRLLQNGQEITGKTHEAGSTDANRAGSLTHPGGRPYGRKGRAEQALSDLCASLLPTGEGGAIGRRKTPVFRRPSPGMRGQTEGASALRALNPHPQPLSRRRGGQGAPEPQSCTNPILPSAPFFQTYQT